MDIKGLIALAEFVLPSDILSRFTIEKVIEENSVIKIYLDEIYLDEYKNNPNIESKGFLSAVTIRDFPIRDKGVDLIVRRRRWVNLSSGKCFASPYPDIKAEGTRYSKEFASFLKDVYGDESYDLPFA